LQAVTNPARLLDPQSRLGSQHRAATVRSLAMAGPADCRSSLLSRAHTVICVPGLPTGRLLRGCVTPSGEGEGHETHRGCLRSPGRACPGRGSSAPSSPVSLPSSSAPIHHHHRLTSRQAAARNPGACDPSLWRAIYDPSRLHVVAACKTVTGTVDSVRSEPDGDVHVLLRLPVSRSGLLNERNISDTHGDLVAEIICVGPSTQADAESACAGHVNHVAVPSPGQRVRISGTYVLDAVHGWMEIHPVSRLSVLSAAAPA
jgi:hypothetical protein